MVCARLALARTVAIALAFMAGCKDTPASDQVYPPSPHRPPNLTCLAREAPPPRGRLMLERAFEHVLGGAAVRRAIELVQSPADPSRWFLAVQGGQVLSFSSDPGVTARNVVLDLTDVLDVRASENGLVGLALHPEFGANGYAYVVYTTPSTNPARFLSRLSRFTMGEDGTFARASELVLLDIEQVDITHSGNHVAFGNDGYLYYSVGDDRRTLLHSQDPHTVQGALLRIDVDQEDPARGKPYSIPPDNPFVEGGGALEVYAYGLRNPWRFTIDPETSAIVLGDVGQDRREEINVIEPAGNYGWPYREGTLCFSQDPCDVPGLIDPVVEMTHSESKAVVAGFRYERTDVPGLQGRHVFGDWVFGHVFSVDLGEEPASVQIEVEGSFHIVSFARAHDGTLYAVRYAPTGDEGGVYRLAPAPPPAPSDFPQLLSQTGCVDPADPRAPAPGVVPFAPSAELWSDGADKERYLAIPDDRRIDVSVDGGFLMPPGTVLVKHFRFGERYHETRLLMRAAGGWAGYSYAWDDTQTDAVLLESAAARVLPNGVRWLYPSRSQCMQCHTEVAHRSLGLEVGTLDHEHAYDEDTTVNQLEWLWAHDYFVPAIGGVEAVRGSHALVPNPFGEAPGGDRARAYLHANCAMCHQPGAPGRGEIDLRFATPFGQTRLCDEEPRVSRIWDLGNWEDQLLLRPGRPGDSIVYLRTVLLGHFRMPPVGSDVVDDAGASVLADWIEAMESCP
jgi:uncharacterized repeat protein (TIGR03806 family)